MPFFRWATYLKAFDTKVWLAILAVWIVASVTHWLVRAYEIQLETKSMASKVYPSNLFKHPNLIKKLTMNQRAKKIPDILFTYFGCMVQQGKQYCMSHMLFLFLTLPVTRF